jgi:hypothetical protein
MTDLAEVVRWVQACLPDLLAKHDVPGAGIAVCVGDEVADYDAAC